MRRILRCRRCKQMFEFTAVGQLCPNCIAFEEQKYQDVRSFIKDNPGVSVNEISSATGVNASKIIGYIKEERLEIMAGSSIMLKCKNCGQEIATGMFCDSCKRAMSVDGPKMQTREELANRYLHKQEERGQAITASSMKDYRKDNE
ncbi:MAG: hypothetical protein ACK5LY_05315 [Lachnospirales bacterium]